MVVITKSPEIDTSFLDLRTAKAKAALYQRAQEQVLALEDTLTRLEMCHKAQLTQCRGALQQRHLSDVAYHGIPKSIAELLGNYMKARLGRFMMPHGVHLRKQVRHINENDPLS